MTHRKNIQASEDHAQRTSCRTRAASACAGGLLAAPLLLSPLTDAAAEPTAPESPPNVLMIIVDDLRPELPAYGVDRVHSPNLDRLAGQSVVFERAYCQTPICGPSRASFLTGLRPEGNRFRTNQNRVNKQVPDAATIPGYFKEAGYTTRAFGKVFHSKSDMAQDWTIEQFDAPKTTPSWRRYQTEENIAIEEALAEGRRDRWGPAVEVAPDDATLRDTHTANAVIEQMRQQQEAGEPFMLAAGFYRPHLPFIAPQRDWDRYPAESIELPTSGIPKGAEPAAHNWGELRSYGDIPRKGPVSDEKAVELVRGYLASVTHVDREIGRVLDALDEMGIADDTIVVLFGDHGWFLRDHGLWCKHSTFHDALHVPLIVRAPGVQPARSDALVELVDVFPTLSELAGLPIHRQCEGNSFVPLLHDPQRPWKQAVFTRFMNQNTVVTQRYAYTQFRNKDTPMAYDLVEDPIETKNLALDPEHEDTIAELAETLEKGWRHFRPD
ncbi:MAG: sulfatase, partial [Phycisphaeraceae bacterium]